MFVLLVQYIKLNLYCVTQLIGLFRWKHLFLMWVSWASTWSRLEWVWAERRCREFFLLSSSLLSHSCCCNADYGAKFWEQRTAILLLKLLLKGTTIASMNQLKKRSERLILRRMRWGSKKCGIENELDMLVIKSSKKNTFLLFTLMLHSSAFACHLLHCNVNFIYFWYQVLLYFVFHNKVPPQYWGALSR